MSANRMHVRNEVVDHDVDVIAIPFPIKMKELKKSKLKEDVDFRSVNGLSFADKTNL